jgi:hypothetical protein
VDACNPLLQAHPTWARDEHEGRGIPTSLTPVSGCLSSPLRAQPRADPSGLGHAATFHSSAQGPPGLETPTLPSRFAGNLNAPRISVFNRLGSSSGARGSRFPVTASSSGAPSRDLHRRLVPSVGLPRLNRSMIGRGRQGCDDCSFSISNSTAGLLRTRRLHWRPILRNGPLRPGPGLSPPTLGRADLSGSVSSEFLCQFCKARGHLELFCNRKKSEFGFPLSSFPSFESNCLLEGSSHLLDFGSLFCPSPGSLTGGTPPTFACFGEFARAVLLKIYEQAPETSLELSLGVTSPKPQTAPLLLALRRPSKNLSMAYRRVDPEPFLPPGFSALVVQHRGIMVRSVSQRLPPMHEDWAIINIHPLPEHEVLFPAVRDVVREYLVKHRRVGVRAIQRSHLGQVIVQFRSVL